jgi:hypothetical protein
MCFYVKFLGLHGVTLDNNIIIHTLCIIILVCVWSPKFQFNCFVTSHTPLVAVWYINLFMTFVFSNCKIFVVITTRAQRIREGLCFGGSQITHG